MEAVIKETGNPFHVYSNESVFLHQSVMIAGALPLLGRALPIFALQLQGISVLMLRITRSIGPTYRNIFVIQRADLAV